MEDATSQFLIKFFDKIFFPSKSGVETTLMMSIYPPATVKPTEASELIDLASKAGDTKSNKQVQKQ